MNRSIFFFFFLVLTLGPLACKKQQSQTPLADKRVLILGNSITQNGAYVSFLEYYLRRAYPGQRFDIISIGLGSETVSCLSEPNHPFPRPCLSERLDRALDKVKPELVLACYGMNDGIYYPLAEERMAAYQNGIFTLHKRVKQAGASLILLTPPPFDTAKVNGPLAGENAPSYGYQTPYHQYDQVLAAFSQWLLTLPDSMGQVIDLHGPMNEYLAVARRADSAFAISTDGIHPTQEGHLLLAHTILQALGVPTGETISEAMQRLPNDALFQLVRERRETRSQGWLAYVGYTRGETVRSDEIAVTEQKVAALEEAIRKLVPRKDEVLR